MTFADDMHADCKKDVAQLRLQLEAASRELEETKNVARNLLDSLKEEQDVLARAKAKDETLLSSIGDGLIAVDKDGVITLVNPSACAMLGVKEEEVIGNKIYDILPVAYENGTPIPREERLIYRAIATRQMVVNDPSQITCFLRKDGTRFPSSITATPILFKDELVGAIESFRDITHEREIDRVKSEFVSLASHQLRTPLSTINWYAEMLVAGDAGVLTDEQKKYVEEIYKGNQRMVELVNALLNVSRLELGTFVIDPEPTDVIAIAKDVVQELEPKIFERKMDMKESYAADVPSMKVDPNLMRIVFQNLVSNAVKYTPPEGHVTLAVESVDGPEGSKRLQITVSDNGFGIPKDAQAKIFTKLYRADNVRIRETDGTGLGLYIVKSILDQTGGGISFVSEENKGTIFTAFLPLEGMRKREGTKALGS
ncbi:MAG TPA: PAS domain-containing sensor histidine kinase [Candidatus Paceibacterota bacterium]|nr:PAS domain-containing sensor histidine kinase [Candidatus Paceibacterota bacterium]